MRWRPAPQLPASAPDAWRALEAEQDADQDELQRLRTLAAQGGDRDAQIGAGAAPGTHEQRR
ncbi:hypothetical protein [Massilia eburnea]|uniref:hypothetical protein n=1 Tax=Massilia eburnea TaxID=1776165 RepID=UPI003D6C396C